MYGLVLKIDIMSCAAVISHEGLGHKYGSKVVFEQLWSTVTRIQFYLLLVILAFKRREKRPENLT